MVGCAEALSFPSALAARCMRTSSISRCFAFVPARANHGDQPRAAKGKTSFASLTFALHGPLLVDHRLGDLLELAVERLVLLALQAKARGVTRGPEADEGENAKGRTLEFCIS